MVQLKAINVLSAPPETCNFNSFMVQLKEGKYILSSPISTYFNSFMVQLKGTTIPFTVCMLGPFQFLHGTIKSQDNNEHQNPLNDFNSFMVQLKVPLNALSALPL